MILVLLNCKKRSYQQLLMLSVGSYLFIPLFYAVILIPFSLWLSHRAAHIFLACLNLEDLFF